jgi:hypothetical protein
MNSPSRCLLAGATVAAVLFTAGNFIGDVAVPARQAVIFVPPDRLPMPATRAIYRPAKDDRQAIDAALAAHGNRQNIVPTFFTDLIRTMERSGVSAHLAREVAVTLARNPKLDELAAMTIAGCFPAYLAATGNDPDTALAELMSYVQHPAGFAGRIDPNLRILAPETMTRINEKALGGKDSAAELIMEQALLARFNPSLGARILVPR